ncbi:hypothetical protein FE782_03790 [Paenibacillus antri]|uniref:Uncharacterized protein n=1 Tax=Paenibacillus antri TaxID=2582848 RepID=A0A5R9GKB8_9BACL|nr:hypothetical protein [Paenibacillus antri]TLS53403.1 hypothetical protein FE782_03790 [Paenibacillus antri]
MAEYYVNPNVSHMPTANMGPIANMGPTVNAAPAANPSHGPMMASPAFVKPTCSYVGGARLSAEAVLVLFILLVIITRLCR